MGDGSDQLTQYYAAILDSMNDPCTQALMHRTLDIFNNQPPSTASTAETADLAAAGTRAAAVLRGDSADRWCSAGGSRSGSGCRHSAPRRCLFAGRAPSMGARQGGYSMTRRVSSQGSAAAAADAMVSSTRCLFGRSAASSLASGFATHASGFTLAPAGRTAERSATPGAASACAQTQTQAPSGPYRAASTSRTSFSSSHVCLEVVPEAAEVDCDAGTGATAVGELTPGRFTATRIFNAPGS